MSSNVEPPAASDGKLPFASYAQIVRMLLPLTDKVAFYDPSGRVQWISDGMEEPELRMHVEVLLDRCVPDGTRPVEYSASDEGRPTYVFPIRSDTTLVGAMAIVFRDLSSNATYRRLETVERLLAPVLDILSHGYRLEATPPQLPEPVSAAPSPIPRIEESAVIATPIAATLRRLLSTATHRMGCAFGALVGVERPFTLSHRASPDESDLTMNAAIDAVRAPMLKLMQVRKDAVLVNGAAPGRTQLAPYKFLVLPMRPTPGRLTAFILLFRPNQARDFIPADVHELLDIVRSMSPAANAELAPRTELLAAPSPTVVAAPMPVVAAPAIAPRSTAQQVTSKIVVPPPDRSPSASAGARERPPAAPPRQAAPNGVPLFVTPDAKPRMDDRIRAALRDGAFDLYAQKISPLRDERRPARFEVLVRMQDAERLRAPASFFEAAEASTLLPDLDRWVIRSLLGTLRDHAGRVRSGRWEFCINIAAQSLITDRFSDFIVAEVCKSSIPAGLLVFEVSECDALEHQYALEFLGARLRDVGCRIALDNCRAGLSTFGPLHRWPVSCVKIDGSLIRNVTTSKRSESVMRAVTQLAASMGIETVAERVESGELCDKLLDIGFDYAQGFHFGQPQPLAELFS